MQHYDNDADARHEPGYYRVRRVGNIAPDSEHTQQNLDQSRHDSYGECFGEAGGMGGHDDRHRYGHWAGGAGNLRASAPEDRGKESDCDCTVNSGDGSKP